MRDLLLMSYEEAEGYFRECDLVLLPLGSVEQHGPANPLGTDTLIADALAGEVSRRTGVLKLPVIPIGVSFHHMHFPGTLTVSERSLEEYLLDVIRSLARWGVKRVLVVNGHGGNLAALQVVSRRSLEELGVRVYVYQWWTSSSGIVEGLFGPEERGHAAAAETSMIMHLHPESVLADRLLDQEVKEDKLSRLTHFSYTIESSGSGVLGRQRTASAERGRTLFEALVEDLSGIVEELKKVRS
ncbi:MAG: creatininase family protein [Candidatus Korarchaeota archaeon NZ13-K]|nr:MAG: creatininase family protein [Candidatus Korarchaeota archaeon NZ13-K]